ncbi:MAG: hypothetical protein AB1393_07440 [Candidatus Edwardsbacteria bacterium]
MIETLFFSLTVTVDGTSIRLIFGIGVIQKTISVSEVLSCTIVRNSPLCGWGIRYIGEGWLYNVSGFNGFRKH